ncbi:MAG: hypothetical protein AAFZ17_16295 [Cyanobacteria bacterium J06650_10]
MTKQATMNKSSLATKGIIRPLANLEEVDLEMVGFEEADLERVDFAKDLRPTSKKSSPIRANTATTNMKIRKLSGAAINDLAPRPVYSQSKRPAKSTPTFTAREINR